METERSGVPYRESKPSAHRHRTARTTRQINGAKFLVAEAKVGQNSFPPGGVQQIRPELWASCGAFLVRFSKEKQWFLGGHGESKFESLSKNTGFVNFMIIQYFKMLIKPTEFQSFCNLFLWSWRVNVRVTL